jgi:hypothetical protein
LAKADGLDILEHLFEEIIIPQYVFDNEVKRKAGRYYSVIVQAINKEGSVFKVLDRKQDKALNMLSKDTIEEKMKLIAGYAKALMVTVIISDNHTEFKWLDEFITLTHRNILTLCVYFGDITEEIEARLFDTINEQLQWPTGNTFEDYKRKSMSRFKENGWNKYLGIEED